MVTRCGVSLDPSFGYQRPARPLEALEGSRSGAPKIAPVGVLDLFLELAALPSPPGQERAVADRVAAELQLARPRVRGRRGPRSAQTPETSTRRLEPTAEGRRSSSAPTWTRCRRRVPIEPMVEDGVVRNAGGTILGADNKSAVAAMVETARRLVEETRPHAGLELVFTPKEEVGLAERRTRSTAAGSRRGSATSTTGGADRRGDPRRAERTIMEVTFVGRAAHAGIAPGGRRSAIAAAGRAIADMRLGRLDEETTRERRHDRGRGRAQHRPCPLHLQRRGALARRAEARGGRPGDARGVLLRGVPDRVRGGDPRRSRVQGLPLPQGGRAGAARASGARAHGRTSPSTRSPAAAPTRTSSTCAGSQCLNLANGMAEIHTPAGAHRRRRPRGDGGRLARAARGGACRLASAAASSPRCAERHEGLVRLEVDGAACVAYPQLTGPVALGDEVLVNTQARDLGLGSGRVRRAVRESDARARPAGGARART